MRAEFKEQIFNNFLNTREIVINETITDSLIELVTMQIFNFNRIDDDKESKEKEYNRNDHPIKIYINSYGGRVYDCLSVISAIESSKTPIHTIALGKAFSAGFVILVSGHKRFCQKYSTLCYHQMSDWHGGKLEDLKEELVNSEQIQKRIDNMIISKTLLTQRMLDDSNLHRSDWYIYPEEALEFKIVDEIL